MSDTRLARHLEIIKETIILASKNFLTSFSVSGGKSGFILLNFFLEGL